MLSYTDMKAGFEKDFCKITTLSSFVQEGPDVNYMYTASKLTDSFCHVSYVEVEPSGTSGAAGGKPGSAPDQDAASVKRAPFLKRWLVDPNMRVYDAYDIFPPPLSCPPTTFNGWRGFSAGAFHPSRPVDTGSCAVKAYVNHLDVILRHSAPCVDYVVDWIAQILQEPARKTGIALLFKGVEGCGKNTCWNIFGKVLGESKFIETSSPLFHLFGRFSSHREDKFLIVINETNRNDNFSADDQIKDMITCDSFMSEGKGTNIHKMRCYARFVFTANNDGTLKVNPDSRRYVILNMSSELKGNTAYFKHLYDLFDDPHARHELYCFLMARDIKGRDWVNERPLTDYYMEVMEDGMDPEARFLRDFVVGLDYDSVASHKEASDSLFSKFSAWLVDNSLTEDHFTNTLLFGRAISKHVFVMEGHTGLRGFSKVRVAKGVVYTFAVPEIIASMWANRWL